MRTYVAVPGLVGALALIAASCHRHPDEAVEDTSAATAAVTDEPEAPAAPTSPGVTQGEDGEHFERPAPPALRDETPGAAPEARYVWQQGYWRWDAARSVYVWVDGFWVDPDAAPPAAPPPPRVESPGVSPGAAYFYVPGYWRWTGRAYVWRPGRWSAHRAGYQYVQPRWEQVDGREGATASWERLRALLGAAKDELACAYVSLAAPRAP